MKKSKVERALWDAYRLAYKQSKPSANFDELVANAKVNKDGKKEIKYDNYVLSIEEQEKIVDLVSVKHNLTKGQKRNFQVNYHLGCAPRCVEK